MLTNCPSGSEASRPSRSAYRSGSELAIALLISLGVIFQASAQDTGVPGPTCKAPTVPEKFENDKHQNHFVDAARAYETCMHDFVEARQKAAERHSEAGNSPAADFNTFAAAVAGIKPAPDR